MSVDTFWLILTIIAIVGTGVVVLIGVVGLITKPPDRAVREAFFSPEHLGLLGKMQEPILLFSVFTLLFYKLLVE